MFLVVLKLKKSAQLSKSCSTLYSDPILYLLQKRLFLSLTRRINRHFTDIDVFRLFQGKADTGATASGEMLWLYKKSSSDLPSPLHRYDV